MVEIKTNSEADIFVITIDGEIDASSSIQLDEVLEGSINANNAKIIVNGEGLAYISSAGLGVFMSYLEDIKTHNIKMAIYGLNEKVKNVFEILGLDQLLNIVDKSDEASAFVNEV
jgi:anti-sigma B factor antagonist